MSLLIAGYTPFSTVDYPGHTAAVVFTQGCPWRCRYCQNPSLQPLEAPRGAPAWEGFLEWLEGRRGLLDAVVFSGGEPTAQEGLVSAARTVLGRGFRVGLHTNGAYPDSFGRVLPFCDWVGLDIKAMFGRQGWITGNEVTGVASSYESLGMLGASDVLFEVRTTYHPLLLSEATLRHIAQALSLLRPMKWAIQRFQPNSPDPELNAADPAIVSEELLEQLRTVAPNLNISVR